MINFLTETLDKIKSCKHSIDDVMFVGSSNGVYRMSWEEFSKMADFEYDNGFGSVEIAQDLIVYFKDGNFLERREYDGSEWWDYITVKNFSLSDTSKGIKSFRRGDTFSTWMDGINRNI